MSKYMAQKGENYIWEILVRKPLEKWLLWRLQLWWKWEDKYYENLNTTDSFSWIGWRWLNTGKWALLLLVLYPLILVPSDWPAHPVPIQRDSISIFYPSI